MRKKIGIIGHFGLGEQLFNGQTIKTKNVSKALENHYGKEEIIKIDTHGGFTFLLKLPFMILKALINTDNVIILPAQRGLKAIAPLLIFFNSFFKRKLHYCVIGGWLAPMIKNRRFLIKTLKQFDNIYVETNGMKNDLNQLGLKNVSMMVNFKFLNIRQNNRYNAKLTPPIKTLTFSRVIKEKGIEDAIAAVSAVNQKYQKHIFSLDIYGPISEQYQSEFFEIMKNTPDYITYRGQSEYSRSVGILSEYDLLLFPTYYDGEGLAGTLIDALFAGTPVIASDWKFNSEVVKNHETGILFKTNDIQDFTNLLDRVYSNDYDLREMSKNCTQEAQHYLPEKAITAITGKID